MKYCRECGVGLVIGDNWYASFVKRNDCKCIECVRAYNRQWEERHQRERAEYKRQYYEEHKEKMVAYNHQWREENPDYHRQHNRRWCKEHPDRARARINRYRARKANATVEDVDEQEIYELYDNTCIYCGSKENLSLDHIVPLNGGGVHCEANLVVACQSCNSSKSDKPLVEWIQTRPGLQAWLM